MIVWCLMTVAINVSGIPMFADTAVKGKRLNENPLMYKVDFSEYAKKQGYLGDWSEPRFVESDKCVEAK